jgi:hypothetical protein
MAIDAILPANSGCACFSFAMRASRSLTSFCALSAHGPMPCSKPIQSVTPTGATPSAKSASCSLRPTVTTRAGRSAISVIPYLCSMVTGNEASAFGSVAFVP